MYITVLILHSIFRWFVLIALCYAIFRAYKGYTSRSAFSYLDNKVRHWTATLTHLQLTLGILLYIKSPIIQYYLSDFQNLIADWDLTFFGLYHFLLMLSAVVIISIGSARAKRQKTDREKFRTMLIMYTIGFFIILIAVPWPFSPLANRPLIRFF